MKMKTLPKFNPDDLVFAKVQGYPYWPGIVIKIINPTSRFRKYQIQYIGGKKSSVLLERQVKSFEEGIGLSDKVKKKTKTFKEAIKEARELHNSIRKEKELNDFVVEIDADENSLLSTTEQLSSKPGEQELVLDTIQFLKILAKSLKERNEIYSLTKNEKEILNLSISILNKQNFSYDFIKNTNLGVLLSFILTKMESFYFRDAHLENDIFDCIMKIVNELVEKSEEN